MDSRPTSVYHLIRHGESMLTRHGVPNARRNAEWLLAYVLDCRSADLYLDAEYVPAPVQVAAYDRLLARRSAREPLQYILGTTEFMSLPFYSAPGVFIPRPDTEVLVEKLERHLLADRTAKGIPQEIVRRNQEQRLADLGCGSGVIAVSIAKRVPNTWATAVDLSLAATDLTAKNAELNGVSERVRCIRADAVEFLRDCEQPFDVIACNPPYIPSGDISSLAPEVRIHEPRLGLDGGQQGLDFYCEIVRVLRRSLKTGGIVGFEVGAGQAGSVRDMLVAEAMAEVDVFEDYAGIERVVIARQT